MWGTSFADLAKKAQELQDQAAKTASSFSGQTSSGLFNLDAMQSDDVDDKKAKKKLQTPAVMQPVPEKKPVSNLPPAQPKPRPPVIAHGKLKIPSKGPVVVKATPKKVDDTPPPKNDEKEEKEEKEEDKVEPAKEESNEPINETDPESKVESVPNDEDGWADDDGDVDDIDVDTDAGADQIKGENAAENENKEEAGDQKKDEIYTPDGNEQSKEEEVSSEPIMVVADESSSHAVEEDDEKDHQNDDQSSNGSMQEQQEEMQAETVEIMDRDIPERTEGDNDTGNEPAASAQEPPSTPVQSPQSQQPSRTRLVVLISTQSMNRQVKTRQDLVETALNAAGVKFDTMDGAAPEHKELRDELFEKSGIRGQYPQFFLVDLSNGGTTFWGDFDRFQHTNDEGRLKDEFGSTNVPLVETPVALDKRSNEIPDEVLESFSNQIKRIEENYQAERAEMELRHERELREAANHDSCEATRKELEERLTAELRTKDEQLQEVCRRNEGHRLKLDMLKRELAGTQELLEARDSDVGKANQKYVTDLRAMEKKMVEAEAKASSAQDDAKKLQTALDTTRNELITSKQEHNELKSRVKVVAAELKERRQEVRDLSAKIDDLMEMNRKLQENIHSLQEKLNHQGMSQTEKDGEMEELRAKLVDKDLAMEKAEKAWKEKQAKHEQTLIDYKKKAQHSLSMANSRTAAAVQAREEAELDARAARSTADSAFERATKAEIASREAMAEAKATVQQMESERNDAVVNLKKAEAELSANCEELAATKKQLEQALSARDKKVAEWEKVRSDLGEERSRMVSLEQQLAETKRQAENSRKEIEALRDQLQRAKSAADAANSENEKEGKSSAYVPNGELLSQKAHDDATVAALQQELLEANQAIEELKEALKNAVGGVNEESGDHNADHSDDFDVSHRSSLSATGGGSESIPLFYAMEKQAELKTARDEMNRLASVLADVQTEKTEAIEQMEDMRRRMEDAEARLKRYEKLGSVSESNSNGGPVEKKDSSAVNIEYLKHIMLRFLNAKTVTERSGLVPVIGAVLELTPDELQAARQNVEQSGSVTSSLFSFMS